MSKAKKEIQAPDLAGAETALRRAAKRARKIAEETRTPLIFYENGRVVKKYPWREKKKKGKSVQILKSKLEGLLKDMPEKVDVEDLMNRLYLLQKIGAGENDIAEGKTVLHKEAVERLSKKWQN